MPKLPAALALLIYIVERSACHSGMMKAAFRFAKRARPTVPAIELAWLTA
ncbi:MAG: hypothetical protein ACREV5_19345 [Steroidobacter sp.]